LIVKSTQRHDAYEENFRGCDHVLGIQQERCSDGRQARSDLNALPLKATNHRSINTKQVLCKLESKYVGRILKSVAMDDF
jgi:hypothetical protein